MPDHVVTEEAAGAPSDDDPGALPTVYGALHGRDEDLARAEGLIAAGARPVLTIVGPGGVGKTRLAIALGERLAGRFADGVRFVALAGERTSTDAESRVRQATSTTATTRAQVRSWLESCEALLILDNVEQIDGAGRLIAELAPRSGGSRVLVSSRGPLHIAAEQVVRLEPLRAEPPRGAGDEPGPAVALFLEVAAAADDGYAPDRAELGQIAELCRRLDGLPLAIRLAAQRRRLLGVPEMLRRIELDRTLLAGAARDVEERQRTVERSIAWSLDLLTAAERVDAHLMSLAPAGWSDATLADVEPPVPLDALGRMLDLGIVGRDGDRLSMLQTVRDVVAADGTEGTRRENERRFVAAWIRGAGRIAAVGASPAALAEDPNLRLVVRLLERSEEWEALLRFIGVLDRYWTQSGTATAIVGSLRAGLAVVELPDAREQRLVLALASLASALAGDVEEAIRWSARLVASVDAGGSAQERLWARNIAGGAHAFAGNHEEAYRIYLDALDLEAEGADVTKVLVNIAGTAVSLGRDAEATTFLHEARRRDPGSGVSRHPATLMHAAELARRAGDYAAAREYLIDAIHGAVERHERLWQLGAVATVGGVALETGDVDGAAMLLARAERVLEREQIDLQVLVDENERARLDEVRARVGPDRWRELREGGRDVDLPGLMAATLAWLERDGDPPDGPLTPREQEIARFVAAGRTNQEIAEALFLSRRTVQTHVANMLRKLGLPSRSALAAWQATSAAGRAQGG